MSGAPRFQVLQSCFSPSWGGLEMFALQTALDLKRRGHGVRFACLPGSHLTREARAAGLDVLELAATGYVHPAAALRLAQLVRRERVQLVHAHHSRDLATLVPALALAGRRAALVLHKHVGAMKPKRDPYHDALYARVDLVLAISEVIRRNVVETTGVPAARVEVLHPGTDLERFDPARVDREAGRRSLGAAPDTPLVGMLGRFSPGKGHEEFLGATAALRTRHPETRYVIVGEASHGEEGYAAEIRERAEALGVDDIVGFAGFRRDVPEVMGALDVFAFPSHAEAFGMALVEAMAMARPVVATGTDGVLDIVVDGESGLLVPRADAAALAGAIGRLLDDPALRARLGRAARERAQACFDARRQFDRLEGIYARLAPGA